MEVLFRLLIFPFMGSLFLVIPMAISWRRRRLLREGRVAVARISTIEKTPVSVDRQAQYAIHLIRDDDGTTVTRKAHKPDEVTLAARKMRDAEPVTILFDPRNPQRIVFPESW